MFVRSQCPDPAIAVHLSNEQAYRILLGDHGFEALMAHLAKTQDL